MTLLALLVSTDDSVSEVLGRVLPACGIAVERFSDLPTAVARLQQQKFDTLIVDFDEPESAAEIVEEARRLNPENPPVTVALIAERSRARNLLTLGAHFVLYKPVSEESAKASLRALTALLKRERRRAYRVPVQAPVEITLPDNHKTEGILLDLSETGMDVLTAEPQTAGALLQIKFQLPNGSLELEAYGQVAWANPNGQTGVHFLDLDDAIKMRLRVWLQAAAASTGAAPEDMVPHCKLTDLSLGGCYVETDSPFPERALVELCLKTGEVAVHTEGMVRVTHPGHGMGVEFPSRTAEQRAHVEHLISVLQSNPTTTPELSVSPRALKADLSQFGPSSDAGEEAAKSDSLEDSLLELLRQGSTLQEEDFLSELRRQRSGEAVAT
jgi:CheY-like chemotaxis protein